ncbi:MAG: acyl-CoA dehydrogenase family protein, partial [Solirubrobacteraceae bacterium]|nr:acyl-CoA dehydrogenase family protein [Solirubrobacteraceae bacterium]
MSELAAIAPYLLPDEIIELQQLVRDIAVNEVAPRAAELDEKSEYGWEIRKILSENDIFGLPFEEEHGGTGTGTLMLNIAIEELAKADGSTALQLMTQELGTLPIKLFGSDEMKHRLLPGCASGETIPAFGLSEPGAGSDPAGMVTSARLDGDEWVINGTKNWITNTGIAHFYVVFAVTQREPKREITAFVVESDREGFSWGPLEHKLGIKGSP